MSRKPILPALQDEKSPGGTLRCPEVDHHILLEETPKRRRLKIRKPTTTPEVIDEAAPSRPNDEAGPSRPKKVRRWLRPSDLDIESILYDSGSDDLSSDEDRGNLDEEDAGVDFQHLRRIRQTTILAEEDEDSDQPTNQDVDQQDVDQPTNQDIDQPTNQDQDDRPIPNFTNTGTFSWSDDFSTFSGQEQTYIRSPGPTVSLQDPVEFFKAVWDDDIMALIVRETNNYAWSVIAPHVEHENSKIPEPLSKWINTTVEEMYIYFAILILKSTCHRSVLKDYWTTGIMGMPLFRNKMSRNRFLLLSRLIHFVDNEVIDFSLSSYEKKIAKIRPILNHCNQKFAALYVPAKHLSLDESLLLWKGRLSWVQCIRTKAARFGIKSYELCEAESGYLLRCLLYAGSNSSMHPGEPGPIHGFKNCTAKVVLELMDGFLDVGHTLVMDNWYNQLPLTRFLKNRQTNVIGTINNRRLHIPDDIKSLKRNSLHRGEQVARHCGDISLVAWKDVNLVTAMSTYHTDDRVPTTRAGQIFEKPAMIVTYNSYMGGVDIKDQKLSMYLMERKRGKKWYIKVFKRLLNTSLLNTFIIYNKTPSSAKILKHREYRIAVAEGLLQRYGNQDVQVPNPLRFQHIINRLRKDVEHFPVLTEKPQGKTQRIQKRCVRCTAARTRSMVTQMCSFCGVALCLGTCWAEYHNLTNLRP